MMSTSLKLSLVVDNVDPCSVNQCKSGQDGAIFMTVILFKRKKSINQLTLSIYTKNGIKVSKMAKKNPYPVKKFGKWPRFLEKSHKLTKNITYRGVPTPSSYSGSLSLR